MKHRYHIRIDRKELANFQSALLRLNIVETYSVITNTDQGAYYDYLLNLAKYELLYIRLSAVTVDIVQIDTGQYEAKTDKSRAPT
jgi:hypothetical protein